jgi:hypothetical protein
MITLPPPTRLEKAIQASTWTFLRLLHRFERFGLRQVFNTVLREPIAALAALPSKINQGYAEPDKSYTPSARAGREIWFFATAFNARFYTYSFPQRLGASIAEDCWPGEQAQTAAR